MTSRGTTAQPARERILDTAFRLFYAHGPRGVGVDTVIAESGVAKATLYKHFPRKDDLILAYLDQVDQACCSQCCRPTTRQRRRPRRMIKHRRGPSCWPGRFRCAWRCCGRAGRCSPVALGSPGHVRDHLDGAVGDPAAGAVAREPEFI